MKQLSKIEQIETQAAQIIRDVIFEYLRLYPRTGNLLTFIKKKPVYDMEYPVGIRFNPENKSFEMDYEPKFVVSRKNDMMFIMGHEIMHICLMHPLRILDKNHPKIYSMACDLAVNCLLSSTYWPHGIPKEALLPGKFGFSYGLSSDVYYEKLKSNLQENSTKEKQKGEGEQKEGKGKEGEGQGSSKDDQKQNLESSLNELRRESSKDDQKQKSNDQTPRDREQKDKEQPLPEELKQDYIDALRQLMQVVENRQETSMPTFGLAPGNMEQATAQTIEYLTQDYSNQWQNKLKTFIGSLEKKNIGYTWKKEHRRFPWLPGIRKRPRLNIFIGADSSGSIQTEDFKEFMLQIKNIGNNPHFEVWVGIFDTQVHELWKYEGKLPKIRSYNGGTSFDCVFQKLFSHPVLRNRMDLLIFFTDGYCGYRSFKESLERTKIPVLWVLTPQHQEISWSKKVIQMQPNHEITL